MAGPNLSKQLEKTLPLAQLELIRNVAAQAARLEMPVYIVGGFVRDLLIDHTSPDFDFVVEGDAIKLVRTLCRIYGGKLTAHIKFETATWHLKTPIYGNQDTGNGSRQWTTYFLDFTSARSESYKHPGALPTIKKSNINDDLRRRDFTINAMAIRLDGGHWGELLDPLDGRSDLKRREIRVLHTKSFIDDPTRLYRAIRYEKRHGFRMTGDTEGLIPTASEYVKALSAERIRHELDLIMEEPARADILTHLGELDLLRPIHPALRWWDGLRLRMDQEFPNPPFEVPYFSTRNLGWLLWLMDSSEAELDSMNSRLQFDANLFKPLRAASRLYKDPTFLSDLEPSKYVEKLENVPVLAIYAVYLAVPDGNLKQVLVKYLNEWRNIKPGTTGNDLKRLGLPPGPEYQAILRRLRNAWLDGEISTPEQEKDLLKKLMR